MSLEKSEIMAGVGVFGCKIQDMHFTYLGLPMRATRPRVEHYAPLMNRMERQLTSISSLLTHAGRVQLVNSVLSSSPTYTMYSTSVPISQSQFMTNLIESEGIACGEAQILMQEANPWWRGKMYYAKRERWAWNHQSQEPKQGIAH
jgi:hypothetical protein